MIAPRSERCSGAGGISPAASFYQVVSRCVPRAWLWAFDEYAGRDYSHRKDWVLERLRELSSAFAVDVCAYAVLRNH